MQQHQGRIFFFDDLVKRHVQSGVDVFDTKAFEKISRLKGNHKDLCQGDTEDLICELSELEERLKW